MKPDWRTVVSLPVYLVGVCLYALAACVLIIGDFLSGKRHSKVLF